MNTRIPDHRPAPDKILADIADYVLDFRIESRAAFETARYGLIDALGCGLEALAYPACSKLLGPIVPGTVVPHGARVPGTRFQLDPVQAAFNIGSMIRWLDFNDTWLAAEWGHPSDNLGGILATCRLAVAKPEWPADRHHCRCVRSLRRWSRLTKSRACWRSRTVSIGSDWIMCCW